MFTDKPLPGYHSLKQYHALLAGVGAAILFIFFIPQAFALPPMGIYTQIQSTTYSQAMAIDGFIDDFSGVLGLGNTALTHNHVEAGIQYGPWRVSRIMRYDYDLSFSEDTARLNFQIENDLPIDPNSTYDIQLGVEHLRSTGFRLGHQFKFKHGVSLSVGLSWLESEQYYSGSIFIVTNRGGLTDTAVADLEAQGQALEAEAQTLSELEEFVALGDPLLALGEEAQTLLATSNFSGGADYYYYKPALREDEQDQFQDIDFSAPQGQGYTIDLELDWAVNDRWSLGLRIRDLYSQIQWDNTPYTRASFDATGAGVDALGLYNQFVEEDVIKRFSGQFFTPFNPADPDDPAAALPEKLEAIEAANSDALVQNQKYVQRLPQQRFFYAHYDSNSWWAARFQYEQYRTTSFYHLRAEFWNFLALEAHPKVSGYGLELFHRFGRIRLVADDSDWTEAKYLSLAASLELIF